MPPLEFEELVVTASRMVGILVADGGTRFVDRAAARLRIEKRADAAVDGVFLVAQDLLALDDLREPREGRVEVDVEVFGEALHVALRDDDSIVAAAVRRTLCAVILGRHR